VRGCIVLLFVLVAPTLALAQDTVDARMQSWSKALGVECTHCHIPDAWQDGSKPAFDFAARMARMVAALNSGPLSGLEPITCVTCHRGRATPARLARESWEKIRDEHAAEFEDRPNRAIAMSVYAASLGVDCSHCHESDRSLNTKPGKALVREKMLPIFEEIPKHFDKAVRMPQTQCFMCHQGGTKPAR
jgi:formate-dependent nitrite reductase cytochrome c552 subunit